MKHTPLYHTHEKLGAKMVEFAGWVMPIHYTGVIDEHLTVRHAAGLFDVSHMGEFILSGPTANATLQYLTTNDVNKLKVGDAQYSLLLLDKGTIIDDIIIYKRAETEFLLVVNAANVDKDFKWIKTHLKEGTTLKDATDHYALLALQGPKAEPILATLTELTLASLTPFTFQTASIAGVSNCIIARTGYTGEAGFELFIPSKKGPLVWDMLMKNGAPEGIKPVGLAARDTLRLEMKYSLYGHEITDQTNPIEAGLAWTVKMDKGDFMGKEAVLKAMEQLKRKCVGFKLIDKGIPRENYLIFHNDKEVGFVTSGTLSPSLKEPIGTGYVPVELSAIGSKFFIDIRGRKREAEVVKTPFYKRNF